MIACVSQIALSLGFVLLGVTMSTSKVDEDFASDVNTESLLIKSDNGAMEVTDDFCAVVKSEVPEVEAYPIKCEKMDEGEMYARSSSMSVCKQEKDVDCDRNPVSMTVKMECHSGEEEADEWLDVKCEDTSDYGSTPTMAHESSCPDDVLESHNIQSQRNDNMGEYFAHLSAYHQSGKGSCDLNSGECVVLENIWEPTHEAVHVREKKYECPQCAKAYLSKYCLTQHLKVHTSEFECNICGKTWECRTRLNDHMETHNIHKTKTHECLECGRMYMSKKSLKMHQKSHTNKPEPENCEKTCAADLMNTSQADHGSGPMSSGVSVMRVHEWAPTCKFGTGAENSKKYGCSKCGKFYVDKYYLTQHHRVHTREFECPLCGKANSCRARLQHHMLTHNTNKMDKYECSECGKLYSTEGTLKVHQKVHTSEFKCDKCEKTWPNMSGLKSHMLIHEIERPKHHQCSECGKLFFSSHKLKQHQRRHTPEFECEKCGKTCANMVDMKRHRMSHASDSSKPHKCSQCGKAFHTDHGLMQHLKIHTREFECKMCEKAFASMAHLKCHMVVHSIDKTNKYGCAECGKLYMSKKSLIVHQKVHNREIVCVKCGKALESVTSLKRHLLTHTMDGTMYEST